MSYLDQNIVVVPNVGNANDTPKIVFSGANNTVNAQSISVRAYPVANGTVSFEGSAGQLFSITNQLTGTIFSVNDISGIPSIAVQDTGSIQLAPYNGDVTVGQIYDQGTGALQVTGNSTFNGAVTDKSLNLQGGNNLQNYSQYINAGSGSWLAGGGTQTITPNTAVAPDGTTTATTVTTGSGANSGVYSTAGTVGTIQSWSIWLKGAVGGEVLEIGDGSSRTTVTLTTSWVRYLATPHSMLSINILVYSKLLAQTFYCWGAQLELGTVASAYTPTTTVAVTTTNNINVPSGNVTVSGTNSQIVTNYVIGTASPQFSGASGSSTGMYISAFNQIGFTQGGVSVLDIYGTGANGTRFNGNFPIGFTSGAANASAPDVVLWRDAANTLAQRNSTNAQTFRLYNTYTDSSNYERLGVNWSGNTATIQTENAGTGVARNLIINSATTAFQVGGVTKWAIDGIRLYPVSDNATDLGTSGNRVRNAYFSGEVSSATSNATNGLHINSNTVSTSYTIPSGSSASSVGPMTVATGQSVTVSTGSRWVIL